MKKVIIFGATGNVGSYLVRYALDFFDNNEYEIIASGRRDTDFFQKYNIDYYKVDISKKEDFQKLPITDIYAVILLAAQLPAYMEGYDATAYINTNIIGAYNVLEYCRICNADRIIYTQTVFDLGVYINKGMTLLPDMTPMFNYTGDHAMYVITKSTAVQMMEHYHQEYGLKKFVFRLPAIYNYSPYEYYYQDGIKKMRPLYLMIRRAMNSEPIELWGDPNYSKDMVHVNDFSQMICKAVDVNLSEGIYNVGTGMPVTLKEEIETIIEVFSPKDKPSEIIPCPEKPNFGGFLMDISKAKAELNYEPKYTCKLLLEDFKQEMEKHTFDELRRNNLD